MTHAFAAGVSPRPYLLATEYELAEYELWVEPFAGQRRLCVTTDFALPFAADSLLQVVLLGARLLIYCRASETGLWLGVPLQSTTLAVIAEVSTQAMPVLVCEGLHPDGNFRRWVAPWVPGRVSFHRKSARDTVLQGGEG